MSLIDVPRALPEAVRSRLAQATRLYTPVDAGRMCWYAWGNAHSTQPPVVLFHGGSGSWTHWVHAILPLVDAGRYVVAADLPGFGGSDKPDKGGDADALAEPLARGLGILFEGRPVHLVGFSFGGLSAGLMLAAEAQREHVGEKPRVNVTRMVFVGAPAMGVVPERQFELKAWRHLETDAERDEIHKYNLGALMLAHARNIEGLAFEIHKANMANDRGLAHTDILARSLPQVTGSEVYAIYGQYDALYKAWIGQLEAAYREAAPQFKGMQLIPDAGHWVQFEAAEAFNQALAKVLAA
jgi:pimeloyl-ACP methyl ester carboxylesterase